MVIRFIKLFNYDAYKNIIFSRPLSSQYYIKGYWIKYQSDVLIFKLIQCIGCPSSHGKTKGVFIILHA